MSAAEASYRFGMLQIDGQEFRRDVIILPGKVIDNWWRREGHRLCLEDLAEVLDADVEVLVVGTGAYGVMKVPEQVREELQRRGIELVAQRTAQAVQTFLRLRREGRRVAGAFHLTC